MSQPLKKTSFLGASLLAGLLLSASVQADTWQEREALARFKDQLERSLSLLKEAEAAGSGQQSRARIAYPKIRDDLKVVIQGLDIALSQPMMPAAIEPLEENYFSYERAR